MLNLEVLAIFFVYFAEKLSFVKFALLTDKIILTADLSRSHFWRVQSDAFKFSVCVWTQMHSQQTANPHILDARSSYHFAHFYFLFDFYYDSCYRLIELNKGTLTSPKKWARADSKFALFCVNLHFFLASKPTLVHTDFSVVLIFNGLFRYFSITVVHELLHFLPNSTISIFCTLLVCEACVWGSQ